MNQALKDWGLITPWVYQGLIWLLSSDQEHKTNHWVYKGVQIGPWWTQSSPTLILKISGFTALWRGWPSVVLLRCLADAPQDLPLNVDILMLHPWQLLGSQLPPTLTRERVTVPIFLPAIPIHRLHTQTASEISPNRLIFSECAWLQQLWSACWSMRKRFMHSWAHCTGLGLFGVKVDEVQ